MTTTFEVIIRGVDAAYASQAAQEVFREIDRLENVLSRFRPGSDVWNINALAPGQSTRVGIEVIECLETAWNVYRDTNGAFDVTFAARATGGQEASGLDWLVPMRATDAPGAANSETGGFIVGIRPPRPGEAFAGASINLGAIGKGYALDAVVEILRDWDIDDALLHSGTSTALAVGPPPGRGVEWKLGIGGEWGQATGLSAITLVNCAVSGSGTEIKGEHILDPRTGAPAHGHLAAWSKAPTAALSDALSTAFMVMTPDEVRTYCNAHPEVAALVVQPTADPRVVAYGEWA